MQQAASMARPPAIARRTYRSRATAVYLGVIGLLGSTFMWTGGVAIMTAPPGWAPAVGVLLVLIGAAGYLLTFRAARAGIRVDESGVTIRNLARATTIPWGKLKAFSIGAHRAWPRIGIAHLHDGSTIAIWGVQGPNPWVWSRPGRAERMIDELNNHLRAATPALTTRS